MLSNRAGSGRLGQPRQVHIEQDWYVHGHGEPTHQRRYEQKVEPGNVVLAEEPNTEYADDHRRADQDQIPLFQTEPAAEFEVGAQQVCKNSAAAVDAPNCVLNSAAIPTIKNR